MFRGIFPFLCFISEKKFFLKKQIRRQKIYILIWTIWDRPKCAKCIYKYCKYFGGKLCAKKGHVLFHDIVLKSLLVFKSSKLKKIYILLIFFLVILCMYNVHISYLGVTLGIIRLNANIPIWIEKKISYLWHHFRINSVKKTAFVVLILLSLS